MKADKEGKWGIDSLSQFSFIDTDKNSEVTFEELKAAILKVKQQ